MLETVVGIFLFICATLLVIFLFSSLLLGEYLKRKDKHKQ